LNAGTCFVRVSRYSRFVFCIFSYILQCNKISMGNHFFPLPPMVELKRICELDALKREQIKEIETTKRYNEGHAKSLAAIQQLEEQISAKKLEVNQVQSEHDQLCGRVIVSKETPSGTEWFFFTSPYYTLTSKHKFTVPDSQWKKHNCEITILSKTDDGVQVNVAPHMFLLFKEWKKNKSWFAEIWLECDGKEVNAEDIKKLSPIIKEKNSELKVLENNKVKLHDHSKDFNRSIHVTIDNSEKIQIFSMKEFDAQSLQKLLEYLSKQTLIQ